jgi:hypothetical protein
VLFFRTEPEQTVDAAVSAFLAAALRVGLDEGTGPFLELFLAAIIAVKEILRAADVARGAADLELCIRAESVEQAGFDQRDGDVGNIDADPLAPSFCAA